MLLCSTYALLGALSTLGLVGLSQAQITSNATCLSSSSYLFNKEGQSPCVVAAFLGSACNGGQYDVSALNAGEHYIGPTGVLVNPCQCSTVMYTMMGACSACQNASIITWTAWNDACSNVYIGIFPQDIPVGTGVPAWAYSNVTKSNIFDPRVATGNASPESTRTNTQSSFTTTATNSNTISSSTHSQSSTSTSDSPPMVGSSNSDNDDIKKKSRTGVIVGGILGVIAALSLLSLLLFFRRCRRRKIIWYSSARRQNQDIIPAMMEVDPYILQTATRTVMSDQNDSSVHGELRTDLEVLRFRHNTSEKHRTAAAGHPQQSNPGRVLASLPQVKGNDVPAGISNGNERTTEAVNNIPSSPRRDAIVPLSRRSTSNAVVSPNSVDVDDPGDDDTMSNLDADAVSVTVVEADSRRGSAADSLRSNAIASADYEFLYRALVTNLQS